MKAICSLMTALALCAAMAVSASQLNVLPQPQSMTVGSVGDATVTVPKRFVVGGGSKSAVASAVRALTDAGLDARSGKSGLNVTIETSDSIGPEGYQLTGSGSQFAIKASADAGFYYGGVTLAQLVAQATDDGHLPPFVIDDAPRFGYRGMMIDVVRCYLPFDELKRIVDALALLKINTLHLHLTDDNGWRLEIKQYPELTKVGAWRVDWPDTPFPARPNTTDPSEPATYGGYYTQKQMRDLVRYAADRHIEVIPEIEMPAHAVAAIASYPELACPVVDKYVGVFPGIGGKDAAIIMCAGNDDVITFYRNVLDEVMDIFPSEYIHLGGDEAVKTYWNKCPRCHQRMADEGIADTEHLQGWFMDQLISYVRSKGRKAIGWDEVTMGSPTEPITIMGWRGLGNAAVDYASRTGAPFIMTPALRLYMIRYQGPQWFEPLTYFGNNLLSTAYAYEPVADNWSEQTEQALQGIQGSMWTEFCREPSEVEYMLFPRMAGIADAAWRPKGTADWPRFVETLDGWLPNLDRLGLTWARSMYNPQHKVRPAGDGRVSVEVACERPDVELRWGTDSLMSLTAPYTGPEQVERNTSLFVSTYAPDGTQLGRTLALDIGFNKATGRKVSAINCTNALADVLTNGVRGRRNSDFEWATWTDRTAEFTVDLGRDTEINSIGLGTLADINFIIAAPRHIYFYVSDNGTSFTPVGEVAPGPELIYAPERTIEVLGVDGLATHGRYVRVVAVNPGCVPDGLPREGYFTSMCFDEIIIN